MYQLLSKISLYYNNTTQNAGWPSDGNVSVDLVDGANTYFVNESNDWHLTASVPISVTQGGLNGYDETWTNFPDDGSSNFIDKDEVLRPLAGSPWAIGAYEP